MSKSSENNGGVKLKGFNPAVSLALLFYEVLWTLLLPLLKRHHRLKQGLAQRVLRQALPKADIWIQAASVGEAYLALEIVKNLKTNRPLSLLITTNTAEGLQVLGENIAHLTSEDLSCSIGYCPFDRPSLMNKAIALINPGRIVLLESELWPGLLAASKRRMIDLMVVNGRMNEKSLRRYLLWPGFWQSLRPGRIMAISTEDHHRFARLFGEEGVETVNNIKFDRVNFGPGGGRRDNLLDSFIDLDDKFVVLGSVRHEEEGEIIELLAMLFEREPRLVVGLFPRHLQRLDFWRQELNRRGLAFRLRSEIAGNGQSLSGQVILWDRMGELTDAYGISPSVFVGGSLAPVGGQNFLEPLACGVRPVIGPHWHNFAWIGRDIIDLGLVTEVPDRFLLAKTLLARLKSKDDRQPVLAQFRNYVSKRQGGTRKICRELITF